MNLSKIKLASIFSRNYNRNRAHSFFKRPQPVAVPFLSNEQEPSWNAPENQWLSFS